MCLHTPKGEFADVQALSDDDPAVPRSGKSSLTFPYGTISFKITRLAAGESVVLKMALPYDLSTEDDYKLYKIDAVNGWHEIPFGSNDGDNIITITLTDGDPKTDGDRQQDGIITDPSALGIPSALTREAAAEDNGGGGGCSIATVQARNGWGFYAPLQEACEYLPEFDSIFAEGTAGKYFRYAVKFGMKDIIRLHGHSW